MRVVINPIYSDTSALASANLVIAKNLHSLFKSSGVNVELARLTDAKVPEEELLTMFVIKNPDIVINIDTISDVNEATKGFTLTCTTLVPFVQKTVTALRSIGMESISEAGYTLTNAISKGKLTDITIRPGHVSNAEDLQKMMGTSLTAAFTDVFASFDISLFQPVENATVSAGKTVAPTLTGAFNQLKDLVTVSPLSSLKLDEIKFTMPENVITDYKNLESMISSVENMAKQIDIQKAVNELKVLELAAKQEVEPVADKVKKAEEELKVRAERLKINTNFIPF